MLDKKKMERAKSDMCVLHPLPRVNEIATDVDDDRRAQYFEQVKNGKYMRMALILFLLSRLDECDKNEEEGLKWIKKSIEHGLVRSLCTLAHIYMNGMGVAKDERQGFLLYQEAASKGDMHAVEHLIECYENGIGVPIDRGKANELKKRLG